MAALKVTDLHERNRQHQYQQQLAGYRVNINTSNNTWQAVETPASFQLFKARSGGVRGGSSRNVNPMQTEIKLSSENSKASPLFERLFLWWYLLYCPG